jgi:hypothetical protein
MNSHWIALGRHQMHERHYAENPRTHLKAWRVLKLGKKATADLRLWSLGIEYRLAEDELEKWGSNWENQEAECPI